VKVLLDECVDPKASRYFSADFEVTHLKDAGWLGVKNGELVKLAEGRFDVLVTIDSNMRHQTSLASLQLAVVVLEGHFRSIGDYASPVSQFERLAANVRRGAFTVIENS